ncbi:MAG: 2-amino-4-hydroxy-6-hydroxymethyldihydropteridine diphosphokinase [Spirochaetia bacterium]|nr:2-amino-4-hydroxy-6-hydroxymethyldihydropteridine diphosphokinase [Spirochaetota bacterium]MCX8097270.1 2-amino-4-hydroxy-6-hydroxymethyldihydropteridine diphosphokinase [Spirochaetota bacterium]MDW8111878.1 2-amino-4-hydroxy-6-hydroxymethyldihydropteridine diphosphokinase [Spirochaetia bacterium]
MKKVILSLGSNIEPRNVFIERAIEKLRVGVNILKISRIYQTKPWGYEEQNDFLNLSLVGYTNLLPFELLTFIKDIEKSVGRKDRFKWGPREIDIDIVYYSSIVIHTNTLRIPHPYRLDRRFVLIPTFEIEPNFIDPEYNISISKLVQKCIYRNSEF